MDMSEKDIICKATLDTFIRFGIVIAALLGFAGYFFYDGSVGYRSVNEQIACYRAFASLGEEALSATASGWAVRMESPLIVTGRQGKDVVYTDNAGHSYPLPAECGAAVSCPPEVRDLAAVRKSWSDCWAAYSARRHFPIKPAEHGYDAAAIREQWYAGALFSMAGLVLLGFALRTHGRELALRGDQVTAAGQTFAIADIRSIDLRQWGPGYKGVAYFCVNGRRIKVDGMTYGGFGAAKGEPAEQFMKAVLALYKGEIIDYEQAPAKS